MPGLCQGLLRSTVQPQWPLRSQLSQLCHGLCYPTTAECPFRHIWICHCHCQHHNQYCVQRWRCGCAGPIRSHGGGHCVVHHTEHSTFGFARRSDHSRAAHCRARGHTRGAPGTHHAVFGTRVCADQRPLGPVSASATPLASSATATGAHGSGPQRSSSPRR